MARPLWLPSSGPLKDKNEDARDNVASALGKIGPDAKPAVPALTEALEDENRRVRVSAHGALKKLMGEETSEAVRAFEQQRLEKRQEKLAPREEKLAKAEHSKAFAVTCQKCGDICKAMGKPLGPNTVMMTTPDVARAAARYCERCNIVICGTCAGVPSFSAEDRVFVATCPRCGGYVDYAAACHVRKTKARLV